MAERKTTPTARSGDKKSPKTKSKGKAVRDRSWLDPLTWPSLVYRIYVSSRSWESYHFNLDLTAKLPADDRRRKRALAVARVLKSLVIALAADEDIELDKMGKHAARALRAMRDRQEARDGTHRHRVELVHPDGDEITWYELSGGDIVPEKGPRGGRAEMMGLLRSTFDYWLREGRDADDLAAIFMSHANSPMTLRGFLRENGVMPDVDSEEQRQLVAQEFRKRLRSSDCSTRDAHLDLAERLIVAGARALGVKKVRAESLFDWADKAGKRQGDR